MIKHLISKVYYGAPISALLLFLSVNVHAQTVSGTSEFKNTEKAAVETPVPPRPLQSDEVFVTIKSSDPNVPEQSYITKAPKITVKNAVKENPAAANSRIDSLSKQNADLRKELDEIKAMLKK